MFLGCGLWAVKTITQDTTPTLELKNSSFGIEQTASSVWRASSSRFNSAILPRCDRAACIGTMATQTPPGCKARRLHSTNASSSTSRRLSALYGGLSIPTVGLRPAMYFTTLSSKQLPCRMLVLPS